MQNSKMTSLLADVSEISIKERDTADQCAVRLVKQIKIIRGCMIISAPTIDITDDKLFRRVFTDDIGFEAAQNEIILNALINENTVSTKTALYFFEKINSCIKAAYPENDYCATLSLNNINEWIYRFHIVRDNTLFLSENIEAYSEPILYEIF